MSLVNRYSLLLVIVSLMTISGCLGPEKENVKKNDKKEMEVSPESPVAEIVKPRVTGYSDSLKTGEKRAEGSGLNGMNLKDIDKVWSATKEIKVTKDGVTTSKPGGAHHSIPVIAGVIKVGADIYDDGSGFTGVAFGKKGLSGSFWKNLVLMFYVSKDKYALFTGKKHLVKKRDAKVMNANGIQRLEMEVDTAARTVTAKVNGTVVVDSMELPQEVNIGAIESAGFRINEPVTSGKPKVSNYKAEALSSKTAGLEAVDVSKFFVNPDQKSTIKWNAACMGQSSEVPYVVRSYGGDKIDSGNAKLRADGIVTINRSFPQGFFEIEFTEANQTFGIISLEAHSGSKDPFFCIDTAMSWLETRPAIREGLVKIIDRTGIAMSRERLSHGAVNPRKDVWIWEGKGKRRNYETMRKIYKANNVSVLEMLYGAGRHMEPINKNPYFPQNLAESSLAWTDLAKHWQGNWAGVEVWNEPDLMNLPADQYSALVKAASYSMKKADVQAPLVSGVFASMPPGPFYDTIAANGVLEDSDVVSFHSYDKTPAIEGIVRSYRKWLKANDKANMPLWHTECGWSWRNGPARPPLSQGAISALEITGQSIESKACGVDRHFPFVLVYYEEGKKNFSMMGRGVSPLRCMAGYVASISFLSNKKYLGDVVGLDKSVKLARVFKGEGSDECIISLYTGDIDSKATINFPVEVKGAYGIDGRVLKTVGNKIPVPDGLVYVKVNFDSLGSSLKTDTSAAKLYAMGQKPLEQDRLASPLVVQFLFDKTPMRRSASKYLLSEKLAKDLPLNIKIHNLSKEDIKVTPELQLPAGGPIDRLGEVVVPALGSVEVFWKVDASKNLDITETRMITVAAKTKDGIQPTSLAIPFTMEGNLNKHLKRHASKKKLPFKQVKRWESNNVGHGKAKFSVADDIWKMDIQFSIKRGNWAYPILNLEDAIDPAVDTGFLVRARIIESAGTVAIMANPNNPEGFWMRDIFPADGEWHTVYVPFEDMKPGPGHAGMQNTRLNVADWTRIAIGMKSYRKSNSVEISDFYIVGGKAR